MSDQLHSLTRLTPILQRTSSTSAGSCGMQQFSFANHRSGQRCGQRGAAVELAGRPHQYIRGDACSPKGGIRGTAAAKFRVNRRTVSCSAASLAFGISTFGITTSVTCSIPTQVCHIARRRTPRPGLRRNCQELARLTPSAVATASGRLFRKTPPSPQSLRP